MRGVLWTGRLAAVVSLTIAATASGIAYADDKKDDIDRSVVKQGFDASPIPKEKLNLKGKDPFLVGFGSYLVNAAADCNGCHTFPRFLRPGGTVPGTNGNFTGNVTGQGNNEPAGSRSGFHGLRAGGNGVSKAVPPIANSQVVSFPSGMAAACFKSCTVVASAAGTRPRHNSPRGVAGLLRAAWLRPKQTDLVPDKVKFRWRFHHPLSYCCPTTMFRDPATDTDIISAQHFWTGGLETAGPGCH